MAKSMPEILTLLNGTVSGVTGSQPFLITWRNIYYRMSIHTTGTCPRFRPLRWDRQGGYVLDNALTTPAWWISEAYDEIFDTHLLNRYPREPEELRQYRKSVYRPYQAAPLLEAITSLQASIFGESKWGLSISDKADEDYIYGKNFDGKTFVGYFEWMFKAICEDPNSIFFVVPKYDRKNTGEKVEPKIMHVPTTEILYITDTEVVFFEPFQDRNYAWWVTETGYFQFKKDGEKGYTPVYGERDGYYAHLLNRMPIHFAGGIWNTLRYYDSYLKPAQAYCDDFVSAHSDVQMVNKEACFPFIQMVQTDCPSCNGHKQIQWCNSCHHSAATCSCESEIADISKVSCPKCDGAGYQMSFNPGQRVAVPKEQADQELIKIINFDVNINKHLQDTANQIKEGIRASLHQQFIDEAQSGKAKEIDREAEYLYRSMVSNGIWALIDKVLTDVLSLRHMNIVGGKKVVKLPKYELTKPTDFALKTEFDLLSEMKEATTAKMPEFVVKKQVEAYVDKVYGSSDVMVKKTAIINEMDAYAVTPMMDKSAMYSSGSITPEQFALSNNLPTMLDTVIRNKTSNWFVNASYDEIQSELQPLIAAMPIPQKEQPKVETKVIE